MKILVIGGGGQLGAKIIANGQKEHIIYATYMTRIPPLDASRVYHVDKTDDGSMKKLVAKIKPNAVIDTAALHNVDYCENNKEEAHRVNTVGTRIIAKACKTNGAKMVFISTDYVFDGRKGLYMESDRATPINYYGRSKLEGEHAIVEECENHAIARTSMIYSFVSTKSSQSSSGKPLNFAMWVTQKLGRGEPLNIVNDQYSSPTLADSLAEALVKICEKDVRGLYHVAGKTRLNRYDFTLKLAEKMGYDVSLINPVGSASLKQVAERPMNSSLNVDNIEKTLDDKMLSINQALTIFRSQVNEAVTI